jgi:hypothetical protein
MGDNSEAITRFKAAFETGDMGSMIGLMDDVAADDFVQEWPQSGERIEGADAALAVNKNFPGGMPSMRFRRVMSSGDLATTEVELTYADGSVYQGVSILEIRDGKVEKETDYFAQPFDPPQWRAQWVTRMPR